MMELNTNQFKLDNLRSKPPRPTIPYAQFPRPTLQDPEASFENRRRSHTDESDSDSSWGSLISSDLESEADMDTSGGSKHRRRSQRYPKQDGLGTNQPRKTRDGQRDEVRWSLEEGAWSEDDSKSNSDNEGYSGRSVDGIDDEESGLTGARGKGARRKRDIRRLDNRIVKDSDITGEEKKEADKNVLKDMIINGIFILSWYIFSLSISVYNKWMFSSDHLDFRFPLYTTCMHMLVQFTLASLVLWLFPRFRPRADSISHPGNTYTTEEQRRLDLDAAEHKPLMTKWFYFTRLAPCGVATALDIGLGNMSLQFITLTFYTMCKSSALAFVLLFAFLFRLEIPSVKLVLIIATMTVGVIMMVSGEVAFSLLGFILVISAAFFSGFRWALTQILLLRNPATSNPFSSIFFLAPIMFCSLFIIATSVEGPVALFAGLGELIEKKGTVLGPLILLTPGAIAFCMTASEFALLQRTSVVTLSIAGIFKEVITIVTAGQVFEDTMSPINLAGLFVTIAAIAGYNYVKIRKMRHGAQVQAHLAHTGIDGQDGTSRAAADSEADRRVGTKGKGAAENEGLLASNGRSRGNSPQASSPR